MVAVATAMLGGWLGLFTGYGKAFRELSVVVLAVAACGVLLARSGRGIVPLGLAVAIGLTLHRSALGLLPAYAVALTLGLRRHGAVLARRPLVTGLGLALPAAALALTAPKILGVMRSTDALHLAPAGGGIAQMLAAAVAPDHLREIANLVLALAPLAVPAAIVALAPASAERDGAGGVLLALAAPFVLALLVVHPRQGSFRDWDDFSPAAVALGALAARGLARAIGAAAARAGLALAVTLAALAPTVQWLWLEHDLAAGMARVRAYLEEPPARSAGDRTLAWDYLGTRYAWLDSLDASADAYGRAAAITPTPRLLYDWAKAEAARERYDTSRAVLERLTARADTWAGAWGALAFVALQQRDSLAARAAADRALALDPHDAMASEVMRDLGGGARAAPPQGAETRSAPGERGP
jgi:tetratricopeptide (TPR) repeat protein